VSTPTDLVHATLNEHGFRSKRRGGVIRAQCPGHGSRGLTLAITEGRDGRCLLYCHAGCSVEQVLDPLGLKPKDLFVESNRRHYRSGGRR
jgi:putative DNA primase/helicase